MQISCSVCGIPAFPATDMSCVSELMRTACDSGCRQAVVQSGAAAEAHGPIPQAHFLAGLGIEARLDALLESAPPEQQNSLIEGFNRLVGGTDGGEGETEGMGYTYKVMAITKEGQPPPIPFPGSGVTVQ